MTNTHVLLQLETRSHFQFSFVTVDKVLNEIKKLNPRKSAESTDVPVKKFKGNADKFADYIVDFLMNL